MHKIPQRATSRRITLAMIGLMANIVLIAAITLANYAALTDSAMGTSIRTQQLFAGGKQRVLIQGSTLEAVELALAVEAPESYDLAHHALERSMKELEGAHEWLLDSVPMRFRALYGDPRSGVDQAIRNHVSSLREVLSRPRRVLTVDDPAIGKLRSTRQGTLAVLGRAVDGEELAAGVAHTSLFRTLKMTMIATLLLLALQGLILTLVRASRQALETSAKESRDRGRLNQVILDNLGEGVIVADATGKVQVFNRMARDLLGVHTQADVPERWPVSCGLFALDKATVLKAHETPLARALAGQRIKGEELYFRHRGGRSEGFLTVDAAPLVLNAESEKGALVVLADISERKRLERQRLDAERAVRVVEVGRAQALRAEVSKQRDIEQALRHQAGELERSNDDLVKFAYIASHDLKEPLRTVASFADLLRQRYRGRLDGKADQYIDFIAGGARRMQSLLDALLDYSRVGSNQDALIPTDLDSTIGAAVQNLYSTIVETGARVTLPEFSPTVIGDTTQLIQLFQNLISNAIKFRVSSEVPRIRVSVVPSEDRVQVSIRDNGIGIDAKFHDCVFRVFRRLHDHGTYQGTGVGLAICRRIVERHGGKIWIESAAGQGTTVHVALPSAVGPAATVLQMNVASRFTQEVSSVGG